MAKWRWDRYTCGMAREAQRPFHLLLVEDSAADAELVREALAESGSAALLDVVGDVDGALTRLTQPGHRPHLVLLDLRLPGRSGFHVLDYMKAHEELRSIPVLVFSSSSAPADVERAYESYANTYLKKPTEFSDLVEMMASIGDYWCEQAELASSD